MSGSGDGGIRIVRAALRRDRGRIAGAALLLCLHQICEALVPVFIGIIVDRAVATRDAAALAGWVAGLAGLFLILTMCFRFGSRATQRMSSAQAHHLRMAAAAKILHPFGIRTGLRAGELLTIAGTDADAAAKLLEYLPRFAAAVAAVLVCAVGLLVIDPGLGLAVLVATPLVLAMVQAAGPPLTRRVVEQQSALGRVAALATDLVAGLRPLRGIGAEESAHARYRLSSANALASVVGVARMQGVFVGAAVALSTLLAAGVAIGAGWMALRGRISVGELITVLGLAQFLLDPLGVLALLPGRMATSLGSARRLALVEDAPLIRSDGPGRLGAGPHGLSVRGIRYGALDGLDLVVEPGEFLGVVAPCPEHGEALVKILSGDIAFDTTTGHVLIGGHRLDHLRHDDMRRTLLVEPHATDLFSGSLGENLRAGREGTDPVQIAAALRAAAATDVAGADGLDEYIAERGASLSGGQRQRLALARALLTQPPVLVLHDPTTAVDAVTEHAVAQGISTLRQLDSTRFTTVVLTSSPALLARADRVVVIGSGGVLAEGTHAELAAADEIYRRAVLR